MSNACTSSRDSSASSKNRMRAYDALPRSVRTALAEAVEGYRGGTNVTGTTIFPAAEEPTAVVIGTLPATTRNFGSAQASPFEPPPGIDERLHPIALRMPPKPAQEMRELEESIAAIGQTDAILVWRDKNGVYWIIDGVHRLKVLRNLNNTPWFRDVTDETDEAGLDRYVLIVNMNKGRRRTDAQRTADAVKVNRGLGEWASAKGKFNVEQLAAMHAITKGNLENAIRGAKNAPELLPALEAGKLSVLGFMDVAASVAAESVDKRISIGKLIAAAPKAEAKKLARDYVAKEPKKKRRTKKTGQTEDGYPHPEQRRSNNSISASLAAFFEHLDGLAVEASLLHGKVADIAAMTQKQKRDTVAKMDLIAATFAEIDPLFETEA